MIEVLDLPGRGQRRGVEHGRAEAPRVRAHLAAWLDSLHAAGLGEPRAYVRRMLAHTRYVEALERHAPDLLAEVRGIAQGCGEPPDLILALNLIDEEWAFRTGTVAVGPGSGSGPGCPGEKCSSFAVACPDGPTLIGQNMDLGGYTDGFQLALRLPPGADGPAALVFSIAGLIGLMGANAAGVAVCVNSLPQLPSRAYGLPVAFMVRRLLQSRSLDEAAALIRAAPHATNQHYLLAEAGRIRSFECSAAGVVELRVRGGRLLHTNHPLAAPPGSDETPAASENSLARLASLQRRLGDGSLCLAEAQAALASIDDPVHPVCRLRPEGPGLINFTTGAMITMLRLGQEPRTWISAGPPSVAGFEPVALAPSTPRRGDLEAAAPASAD